MFGIPYRTCFVPFKKLNTKKAATKKITKLNALHCIEPVTALKNPKVKVPITIAIFSVTSKKLK